MQRLQSVTHARLGRPSCHAWPRLLSRLLFESLRVVNDMDGHTVHTLPEVGADGSSGGGGIDRNTTSLRFLPCERIMEDRCPSYMYSTSNPKLIASYRMPNNRRRPHRRAYHSFMSLPRVSLGALPAFRCTCPSNILSALKPGGSGGGTRLRIYHERRAYCSIHEDEHKGAKLSREAMYIGHATCYLPWSTRTLTTRLPP